jgi:hypothetical protein
MRSTWNDIFCGYCKLQFGVRAFETAFAYRTKNSFTLDVVFVWFVIGLGTLNLHDNIYVHDMGNPTPYNSFP